jgi:hypothetical protein
VRIVKGFARFWYDFIVGDDWRIALGVVAVVGCGAVLVATGAVGHAAVAVLTAGGIVVVVTASIVIGARGG